MYQPPDWAFERAQKVSNFMADSYRHAPPGSPEVIKSLKFQEGYLRGHILTAIHNMGIVETALLATVTPTGHHLGDEVRDTEEFKVGAVIGAYETKQRLSQEAQQETTASLQTS